MTIVSAVRLARMALRQNRLGLLGWLAGLAGLTAVYASSFASIGRAKSAALESYPAALKQALNLQDLASPNGYLNATVFGIPLLLLVSIYVIGSATRGVAGAEEAGTLDLLLAYPVSRTAWVLSRSVTVLAGLVAMGGVVFGIVLLVRRPAGLHIGIGGLVAVSLTLVLLGACLHGIALLVSCAFGRRAVALGVATAVTLLCYLADSFLPLIDHLGWLQSTSPFHWFTAGDPLRSGLQWRYCALLAATAALTTTAAAWALEHRDLNAT